MGNKVVVSDKSTFKDVAHEFVHHIRKTNPRKYNAIRSYIKNNIKSGLYDFAFDSYKTMYSEVYDFGDFDAMTDEERARATDLIEEELVCDITAYNKVGQGTPIVNEEEFTQLVDELFDTAKETISYTSTENQNNAKPKKSPVKDFLGKLDFLPLPKTKNGNVKRNITQTTAELLINLIDEYAKTGQINKQMANALFDTLYNSSVVESVENFDEAVNHIKNTKLYISPEDKGTIPDFNKFRQGMFKKLDITTDKSKGGLSTDVFFEEFTSLFPSMVDETLTHPADQLQALADFVTDAKSKQTQTLDDYFGEGAESAKEQMHEMFTEELDAYKEIVEEGLWKNLEYFIKEIMPVAVECDVNMAIHPDDPPWSIFGIPRIITCEENIDRFLSLYDDVHHGLTLCSGSLGCAKFNDYTAMVKKYGAMGRIHFAHVRNIKILDDGSFEESGHLSECGSLDVVEILKAYHDTDFKGYLRPDHGRMIWGETGKPGYGLYDRALGAMYMAGIWETLEKGADK